VKTVAGCLAVALSMSLLAVPASRAGAGGEFDALLRELPQSRLSLVDGIRRTESTAGAAISAKFEVDGKGRLVLSVYAAEKGLELDAERNVLKELLGPPTGDRWPQAVEVFEDVPHVARAAQQHALVALSPYSLADAVGWAEKDAPGTVVSVIPILRHRKAVFRVLVAQGEKVAELLYDMRTGRVLPEAADAAAPVTVKVEAHATKKEGAWSVEFGCSGAEEVFFRIEGGTPARLELVASDGRTLAASWSGRGKFTDARLPEGFGPAAELRIYPAAR
jgi:hypothetical protein